MLLEIQNVVKTFPGTIALNEINFDLEEGEIHAIVGENGAGKSTLMKILSGIYVKDSGTIRIDGRETELGDVDESRTLGISMIYQEMENIQKLSVAENIFLGQLPKSKVPGFVDFRKLIRETKDLLHSFELDTNPTTQLSRTSTAEQQFIEIIKAITIKNARVIIMDEPTSSLTNKEVEKLFQIIRELKNKGISVIYISHRLDEIIEIADRVSVFRDGKNRGVLKRGEYDTSKIVSLMIGHELESTEKNVIGRKKVVFEIKKMNIRNKISDFSMQLHEGEILAIAGLMGSGKDQLVKGIVGLWPAQEKEMYFLGNRISINHPADAIEHGIIYLPEERKLQALFLDMSVNYNISPLWLFNVEQKTFINKKKEVDLSKSYANKLSIKTPSVFTEIVSLSGGNQQKAIFSRMLAVKPKLMILNDPTRGIDVGSKQEIYSIIQDLASKGVSILLLSSEIPEITKIANTVIVLSKGETRNKFSDSKVTTENIIRSVTRV
ncbi:MAG: sugar ABC transporter ATP-binding protein [Spirochaetales bacterium]|nr:sugar ABC transporter ATP-binding protein [Spirochaetales bacterium]